MELNSDDFTYFKVQYRHLLKWTKENHAKPQEWLATGSAIKPGTPRMHSSWV